MMPLRALVLATLALPALAGCPTPCDGTEMSIQNLTSMAIPDVTPETLIEVGDINLDIKAEYIRVTAGGTVLAEKTAVAKGDVLAFSSGGAAYQIHVDRIEHHITSTDYAHLCVTKTP